MAILGVERLVYGVEDLQRSTRFFDDFGLELKREGEACAIFGLPEGSSIELRAADDPDLPPPCGAAIGPREVVWGVDSLSHLEAIADNLSADREVVADPSGALHTRDDAGLNIAFRIWRRADLEPVTPAQENAPGQVMRWNRNRRWYPRARPQVINHVVFGTPDVEAAAAFYTERLGFRLTDIMRDVGMFLRCDGRHEHHNLFFRKRRTLRFEHVSFGVQDIDELMVGANEMRRRGWSSSEGLGRHRMGSLLFYYIDSPAGGQAEYTADGDYVTDDWKPRIWDVAFGNHYWLAEPGDRAMIDHAGKVEDIVPDTRGPAPPKARAV